MHPHHISRAVDVLAAIARIPSLAGGQVVFAAGDLSDGRWYEASDYGFSLSEVTVPVPAFANEVELRDDCRVKLELALEENRRARRENDDAR